MAINPTIIPQKIDLSKSVDGFTIDFKQVLGSGSEELKLQLAKAFLKDMAEHNLRITSLEVNAGISGADDELSDIFEVPEGIKNSVDFSNTTSLYDNTNKKYINSFDVYNYSSPYPNLTGMKNLTANTEYTITITPKISEIIKLKTIYLYSYSSATFEILINGRTYSINANNGLNSITLNEYISGAIALTLKPLSDVSVNMGLESSQTTISDSNIEITSTSNGWFLFRDSSASKLFDYSVYEISTTLNEVELWLKYTLSQKPQAVYLALYSGAFQEDEIGDVYFYFTDGTHNSLLMRPWTIYNGLNLSFTPTHIVIVQKDTQVSKISKYVLLIAY